YRITSLALWNARAAGLDAESVVDALLRWSRYAVPQSLLLDVAEVMERYGRLVLEMHPVHGLVLRSTDQAVFEEVLRAKAVEAFVAAGSGVVVLPCGAGKTLVGLAAMARTGARTLILVTNIVAARQWRRELLAHTALTEDELGEYSGERKEIRPVTLATYQ